MALDNGIPIAIHLETFIEQEGEKNHLVFELIAGSMNRRHW